MDVTQMTGGEIQKIRQAVKDSFRDGPVSRREMLLSTARAQLHQRFREIEWAATGPYVLIPEVWTAWERRKAALRYAEDVRMIWGDR